MMKKWMSLLMALCMMVMILPATAETATETATETTAEETATGYVGIWNLCGMVENGILYDAETVIGLMGNYQMTLNEDGTGSMLVEMVNDTMTGTWKEIPGGIEITINDQTQQAAMTDDGLLYLTAGENASMIFSRQSEEETAGAASGKGDLSDDDKDGLLSRLGSLLSGSESGKDDLGSLLSGLKESGQNLLNGLKTKLGDALIAIGGGVSELGNTLGGGKTEGSVQGTEEELMGDRMVKNLYNSFVEITSVEQIYGAWKLKGFAYGDTMIMTEEDGTGMSEIMVLSENKMITRLNLKDETLEETEDAVNMEVKDGTVVITYPDTKDVLTVRKAEEEGVLVAEIDKIKLIYSAVTVEAK